MADQTSSEPTPAESFRAAQNTIAQLGEYLRHYFSARLDALRLSVRNALFYAILSIIGAIILVAVIATAVVLTCVGLAEAISALFGHHVWLGNLLVGLMLLGGIIGAAFFIRHRISRASQEKTARKYAGKRKQQRATFGEDVGSTHNPRS